MSFHTTKKQNIFVLSILVIFVVWFGYSLLSFILGDPEQSVHVEQSDEEHDHSDEVDASGNANHIIVYTETGFIPKRLEVVVGETVVFTNLTEIPMWVGSDPHPEHTDHSDFDALADYGKDNEFDYTFEITGTFGFHNHNKSVHRGTIVVSDHSHEERELNKTPEGLTSVRDELLALFIPDDPNSIFTIVDAVQADPGLALNCHDVAHDLGHRAYELYGFSEAMTFNNPNHVNHPLVQYICAGGYMHGILEQLSLHQPEFMATPDVICELLPEVESASCYHGIGHVFMLSNEREIDGALNDCRRVEVETDMYRCFEGIRMEQFWGNTDHVGVDTLGWDTTDPLATCMNAKPDEQPTCFLYAPFGYLRENPKDYFGAVTTCTQSSLSEANTGFCLKGLGITMMSKFKGQNLEGSEVYVTGLSPQLRYSFYQGVLGYAQLSGVQEQTLQETCELFQTDNSLCLNVLNELKPTYEAYADLASRQTLQAEALTVSTQYFDLLNDRNLIAVEKLLTKDTTYSSEKQGVYLGQSQIMEILRNLLGGHISLTWKVDSVEQSRPGVVLFNLTLIGTTTSGQQVSELKRAYIIVSNNQIKHIEIRDL
jgi:plastocyanin